LRPRGRRAGPGPPHSPAPRGPDTGPPGAAASWGWALSVFLVAGALRVGAGVQGHVLVVRPYPPRREHAPEIHQAGLKFRVVQEVLAVDHHRLAAQVLAARPEFVGGFGHGVSPRWPPSRTGPSGGAPPGPQGPADEETDSQHQPHDHGEDRAEAAAED